MAHFCELDENNIVIQTVVINNDDIKDENGVESEQVGIEFCKKLFNSTSVWIQTSYNGSFRKKYGYPGCVYDALNDAFIPTQPFPSWVLNRDTYEWEPPVRPPEDGLSRYWNEQLKNWAVSE